MRSTEQRLAGAADLDLLDTADLVRVIHDEDSRVITAVSAALPTLVQATDLAVAVLRAGGRVHYFGAGSSGRYGVLDAAEIPPTYGLSPDRFVAHLAGGDAALTRSVEGIEDDAGAGEADAAVVASADLVVGLTASGRTPYVGAALRLARMAGAQTVLLTCTSQPELGQLADVQVVLDTGPEVIMGSTRMKAGAATKIALHTFSTAVMVRLGRTYSNLMVEVVASNDKLRARRVQILVEATGAEHGLCVEALRAADDELTTALVSVLTGSGPELARAALRETGGTVRAAVTALRAEV